MLTSVARVGGRGGTGHCAGRPSPGLSRGCRGATATYLRPDSMNLSYSTDILQHSAWRVCTAEQLVLITWPPAGLRRRGSRRVSVGEARRPTDVRPNRGGLQAAPSRPAQSPQAGSNWSNQPGLDSLADLVAEPQGPGRGQPFGIPSMQSHPGGEDVCLKWGCQEGMALLQCPQGPPFRRLSTAGGGGLDAGGRWASWLCSLPAV